MKNNQLKGRKKPVPIVPLFAMSSSTKLTFNCYRHVSPFIVCIFCSILCIFCTELDDNFLNGDGSIHSSLIFLRILNPLGQTFSAQLNEHLIFSKNREVGWRRHTFFVWVCSVKGVVCSSKRLNHQIFKVSPGKNFYLTTSGPQKTNSYIPSYGGAPNLNIFAPNSTN